jgi:hypothetical protein
MQPPLSSHASVPLSTHVSIHPSCALSPDCLHVWEHASSYIYKGRELSLNNMIAVLALAHSIPKKIANWVKDVVWETVCANLSLMYNTLGNKIYGHKDMYKPKVDALEWEMGSLHTGLAKKFHSLEKENQQWQAEMDTYVQNNKMCKTDIWLQRQDFDALYSNMQAMVTALNCISKDNMDLHTHIEHLEKCMDAIPAIPLVLPPALAFALAPAPVPPVHAMGIPLVPVAPQAHFAGFPLVPVAPVAPVTAPLVPIACLHTANTPKYLDNNKKQSLEHWLLQLGIWMRINQILSNKQHISTALMQLEGGAAKYCNQFIELAAQGRPLGTWENFVMFLQVGYCNMAPTWCVQEQIEAYCAKRHNSMTKFAEDFWSLAQKFGYLDVKLIHCIDDQCSNQIRNIMISTKMSTPGQFLTNWQAYLDYMLGIEARVCNLSSTTCNQTQGSLSSKPIDAMDVNAI